MSVTEGLAILGQSGTPTGGLSVSAALDSLRGANVVAATPDGTFVFAAGPNDGSITVRRASAAGFSLVEVFTATNFANATALTVSADGRFLYAATLVSGNDAIFTVRIDPTTGRLTSAGLVSTGIHQPYVALLGPAGGKLYGLLRLGQRAGFDPLITFGVNAAAGTLSAPMGYFKPAATPPARALTLSDDGTTLFVGKAKTIDQYARAADGSLTLTRTLGATPGQGTQFASGFNRLTVSSDGKHLFTIDSGGTLSGIAVMVGARLDPGRVRRVADLVRRQDPDAVRGQDLRQHDLGPDVHGNRGPELPHVLDRRDPADRSGPAAGPARRGSSRRQHDPAVYAVQAATPRSPSPASPRTAASPAASNSTTVAAAAPRSTCRSSRSAWPTATIDLVPSVAGRVTLLYDDLPTEVKNGWFNIQMDLAPDGSAVSLTTPQRRRRLPRDHLDRRPRVADLRHRRGPRRCDRQPDRRVRRHDPVGRRGRPRVPRRRPVRRPAAADGQRRPRPGECPGRDRRLPHRRPRHRREPPRRAGFDATTVRSAARGQAFTRPMPGFDAVGTSADGRYLYGISSAGNAVVSYDTVNATSVGVVNGFGGATTLAGLSGLAVRPAGSSDSLYALAPASGSVTVARRRSDSTLTLEGGFTDASLAGATALTWSTPAGRLYTAAGRNVRRYGLAGDLPTLFGLVSVAAPAAVTALAVDAAGRLYAAGGGLLTVYNSDLKTPVTLSGLPNATAVLANGNRVSLAGSDGSVTVLHWNAGFTALSVETTFRQGVGGVTGLTGVAVVNNTLWVSSRSGPGGFAPLTITAPGFNAQLIALQTGLTRSRP